MTLEDRVLKVMREAFDITGDIDVTSLVYKSYPAWSSLGHMTLVAALEDDFDVMLDTDDILAMSSYEKVVQIMAKYHA